MTSLKKRLQELKGNLVRSGDVELRNLALTLKDDDEANPQPPKEATADETLSQVPADDEVTGAVEEPKGGSESGTQDPALYAKATARPSAEITEENATDQVKGPLLANPEPAQPGVEDEVIKDQKASRPSKKK